MEYRYSLKKGIFNDNLIWLFFDCFIFSSVYLIVVIIFNVIPDVYLNFGVGFRGIIKVSGNVKIFFVIWFFLLDLILIIAIIYRINKLKYLFNHGLETDAKIFDEIDRQGRILSTVAKNVNKAHGFVYIYKINNIEHKFTRVKTNMEISLNYKKGDIIKMLVDPRNHKKSVFKDKFIDK
jgi:hypothetical protein